MNPLTERDQFLRWKEHPLTQAFLQFLRDQATEAMRLWASEATPSAQMQPDQTRAGTWLDLCDLECADVRRFYRLDEEGETDEQPE